MWSAKIWKTGRWGILIKRLLKKIATREPTPPRCEILKKSYTSTGFFDGHKNVVFLNLISTLVIAFLNDFGSLGPDSGNSVSKSQNSVGICLKKEPSLALPKKAKKTSKNQGSKMQKKEKTRGPDQCCDFRNKKKPLQLLDPNRDVPQEKTRTQRTNFTKTACCCVL